MKTTRTATVTLRTGCHPPGADSHRELTTRLMSVHHCLVWILGIIVCSAVSPVSAQPVTVPDGLNPGDTYRLIFLSAREPGITAQSSNIEVYNAFVAAEANAVPELQALGTTWKALGSTSAIDARDNTSTNPLVEVGYPIYTTVGSLIATDNSDLWDPTDFKRISSDAMALNSCCSVWTGTQPDGTADPVNYLGAASVNSGTQSPLSDRGPGEWIDEGASPRTFDLASIYGISGPLTVVPEPSTVLLSGLASTVLLLSRRRWK